MIKKREAISVLAFGAVEIDGIVKHLLTTVTIADWS